jgi:uncharacterized membrane protein
MPYLTFYPVLENAFATAALLLFMGAVVFVFRGSGFIVGQRRILIFIRLLLLLVLAFAMLRPTLIYTETQRLSSTLHILLDTSESMTISDEAGGKSRYDTAVQALNEARESLQVLQKNVEVSAFAFDKSPNPLNVVAGKIDDVPAKPVGQETALGYSLEQVLIRSRGSRIIGTILLTDGTQRSRPPHDVLPQDTALRYRDSLVPIYPVLLGRGGSGDVQDVAVTDLLANDRVFVKNDFQVSGTIRVTGYMNQPIPVQLLFEDENGKLQKVAETEVVCREEGQLLKVNLSYQPPNTGLFKYVIDVPQQAKELIATNNSMTGFVRVIDGGLRVMYLQGDLRNEHRFIKEALDASHDIQVSFHRFRIEQARRESRKTNRPLSKLLDDMTRQRMSLVDDIITPEKYDVFVIDDIDATAFKKDELEELAKLVRGGCGLLMLGGNHSFGAGGYYDTPLDSAIPIAMSALDRQPLDEPLQNANRLSGDVVMLPSERGVGHPVMQIEPNRKDNDAAWRELPALRDAVRFGRLKPGATVLAQSAPPQEFPLLVTQLFGEGRVVAFAGDSTWRWAMHGFRDRQKRFWRQIILWLAKMDDSAGQDCWIKIDKTRVYSGEQIAFQVFMKSTLTEVTIPILAEAELVKPNGKTEKIPLIDIEGGLGGTIRSTEQPGDYKIQVKATEREPNGDEVKWREAAARFFVFNQNMELDNPIAYPNLLENIAATSDGHTIAPEQLNDLLKELEKKSAKLVETRETKRSLYDTSLMLLLVVGLYSVDWYLRKRWGGV